MDRHVSSPSRKTGQHCHEFVNATLLSQGAQLTRCKSMTLLLTSFLLELAAQDRTDCAGRRCVLRFPHLDCFMMMHLYPLVNLTSRSEGRRGRRGRMKTSGRRGAGLLRRGRRGRRRTEDDQEVVEVEVEVECWVFLGVVQLGLAGQMPMDEEELIAVGRWVLWVLVLMSWHMSSPFQRRVPA